MLYVGYSVLASAVHHTPTCAVGVLLCDMRRFVQVCQLHSLKVATGENEPRPGA